MGLWRLKPIQGSKFKNLRLFELHNKVIFKKSDKVIDTVQVREQLA